MQTFSLLHNITSYICKDFDIKATFFSCLQPYQICQGMVLSYSPKCCNCDHLLYVYEHIVLYNGTVNTPVAPRLNTQFWIKLFFKKKCQNSGLFNSKSSSVPVSLVIFLKAPLSFFFFFLMGGFTAFVFPHSKCLFCCTQIMTVKQYN